MRESPLLKRIMLAVCRGPTRLFRTNSGMGWVGDAKVYQKTTIVSVNQGDVVIRNARPFRSGFEGMSDLNGWHSVEITKDMVGRKVAIYTAIEVKVPRGQVRPHQKVYIDMVKAAGGIAGIVRSEEEAEELLT